MNKIVLTILLIIGAICHSNAQNFEGARFPGCEDQGSKRALSKCAKNEMVMYLKEDIEERIQHETFVSGKFIIKFTVNTKGLIKDLFVIEGTDDLTDSIMIKAFRSMNKMNENWTPAKDKGGPIDYQFYSHFTLNKDKTISFSHPYTRSRKPDKIFKVVEQMPRFPGCEDIVGSNTEKEECAKKKMVEYVYSNLKYPPKAREAGVEGTVVVQFNVDKDGSIKDIKTLRDPGAGLGDAGRAIVASMNDMPEKWIPGKQRGVPVRVMYTLPIKFKFDDGGSNLWEEITFPKDEVDCQDVKSKHVCSSPEILVQKKTNSFYFAWQKVENEFYLKMSFLRWNQKIGLIDPKIEIVTNSGKKISLNKAYKFRESRVHNGKRLPSNNVWFKFDKKEDFENLSNDPVDKIKISSKAYTSKTKYRVKTVSSLNLTAQSKYMLTRNLVQILKSK